MDLKIFFSTFSLIFLAELGDKTQLATLVFSANSDSKYSVFFGAAAALVLSSALAVLAGSFVARWIPQSLLHKLSGFLFIILGGWLLWKG